MIHTRFRLDLMVCSLSRKNQAEMEKKMTTPTLPPLAMKNRKKISIASGSLLIGKPFWVIKWYIRIMNIAMMRSSSMLEFLCPPPICASGMCRCAVFGVYAVVVLRVLVLFAHNSPLICGLSSLRILHTQTDWDILLKDKIEQMFECVVCCC